MAHKFPLQWPSGWGRVERKATSRFKSPTSKSVSFLEAELGRMGAKSIVITTNVPLKADGKMRLDREPVDAGVAVYFRREDKDMVFACDQYDDLSDNVLAIGKTIEAMRGIERWGAAELVNRAFSGFLGLPAVASEGEDCWGVLGLAPMSSAAAVKAVHRDMVRKLHAADAANADFMRVNVARDDALRALVAAEEGKKNG